MSVIHQKWADGRVKSADDRKVKKRKEDAHELVRENAPGGCTVVLDQHPEKQNRKKKSGGGERQSANSRKALAGHRA